jgi:hypothetical protein
MSEKDSLQPAGQGDFFHRGIGITRYMSDSINDSHLPLTEKAGESDAPPTSWKKESLNQLLYSGAVSLMEFRAPKDASD